MRFKFVKAVGSLSVYLGGYIVARALGAGGHPAEKQVQVPGKKEGVTRPVVVPGDSVPKDEWLIDLPAPMRLADLREMVKALDHTSISHDGKPESVPQAIH